MTYARQLLQSSGLEAANTKCKAGIEMIEKEIQPRTYTDEDYLEFRSGLEKNIGLGSDLAAHEMLNKFYHLFNEY